MNLPFLWLMLTLMPAMAEDDSTIRQMASARLAGSFKCGLVCVRVSLASYSHYSTTLQKGHSWDTCQ